MVFTIREDDLSGPEVRQLLERHLDDLALHSPAESMHAMSADRLSGPDVTFWSVWSGDRVVGCGALKEIDATHGEVKSMRTIDDVRGQGVGGLVLEHLLGEARRRGYARVSLETGSDEPFFAAHRLYERHGFVRCGPFADYAEDPWSVFMTLQL
ncbi:GNAT family N-acetyltransferase [Aeromicrobium panaciterrae]|uniref:GNAT family N-acetyltransferase n=1 Tax=Aeromicrobium panaciterrae TaxID=363861 RepID=UPI0031DBB8AE